MALIKCNECGKEMSDHAKQCPHCGYEYSKKMNKITLGIIFSILIVCFIITGCDNSGNTKDNYIGTYETTTYDYGYETSYYNWKNKHAPLYMDVFKYKSTLQLKEDNTCSFNITRYLMNGNLYISMDFHGCTYEIKNDKIYITYISNYNLELYITDVCDISQQKITNCYNNNSEKVTPALSDLPRTDENPWTKIIE